ncbi:methyltransferase domain-containing protein [Patescibacteria group bacterium]|nr:methyltransferase domain-containing protein [Patescibacteria group bacterium]
MENEWDIIAEEYSSIIGSQGDVWRQIDIDPAIMVALNDLPKGKILDLGCGEGYLERKLIPMGWRVTGIDFSQEMLNQASSKNSPGEFILGDITKFQSGLNDFDVVIANMSLMDVQDLQGFYQHTYKYLKFKGLLIVTVIHPAFRKPVGRWAKTILGKVLRHDPFVRVDDYTTSGPRKNLITYSTHLTTVWHKQISDYIQKAINQGFRLVNIQELSPRLSDLLKHNQPKFLAKFPHTLFMVFTKDE